MLRIAVLLGAAAVALAAAGGVRAARGVAIDLGRIQIEQRLTPGGSYRLPAFGVRNPGDEETSYVMVANPVEHPEREAPPKGWFDFEPAELTLEPGETKPVRARIDLPPGADPGDYVALVGAQIVTSGGGAQVGAAAAAETTFTVEPASTLQAWWLEVRTRWNDLRPWSWLAPALAVLLLAAWQVRRRVSFTVARRA